MFLVESALRDCRTALNKKATLDKQCRSIMRTVSLVLSTLLLSACASQPGGLQQPNARSPKPDLDAPQTAALFQRSCMRFAGNVAGLRGWIDSYHLPQLRGDQATSFLYGRAGQAFGASNAAGRRVLMSYDNGACEVVAMASDPSAARDELLAILRRVGVGVGVSVTPLLERAKPDGSSVQQMYQASLGSRLWLLSVTAKPHSDALDFLPETHLLATDALMRL